MDLNFTDEELAFRDEVRTFCRSAIPADIRDKLIAGRQPSREDKVRWTRILAEKGWAAPHWPVEHGGTGWSAIQQYIFNEEVSQTPAPEPAGSGINLVGPVVYTYGTEAQKRYFLPRILNVEDWWCEGFSEPGAGSDLAALQTRAVRDGDHYIVNGSKIWTSLAQYSNWIFCLVRTDPEARKQDGISFLLIDLTSPGVTVRPIQLFDGYSEVCQVFFDDVRVPVENRVGEENRGWQYAKFVLGNGRVTIACVGLSKERIRYIKELASKTTAHGERLIDRPEFRKKVAAVEVQLKALEMTQLRIVSGQAKQPEGVQDPATSILKIKGSEIQQATAELLLEIAGPYALPYQSEEDFRGNQPRVGPDWVGPLAPAYFNGRKVPIYSGSDEIQRNIIAKRVLGL